MTDHQPKIETIYDHGVTQYELKKLNFDNETKDEYLYALSQDSAYVGLFLLYRMRKNPEKASYYLEQVQDVQLRNQFKMRPCCAVNWKGYLHYEDLD
ncbi:MAG: hypothetical protein PHE55_18215 [Methylococcaceae bacterium]|nr:hypothetical protein [Methylococcaceae bacterium]